MLLFVDKLTNLDFSYLDANRGILGETWLANVELKGSLDEQGMVLDFGLVKKIVRNWLDDNIDHKLVVPTKAKCLNLKSDDAKDQIHWQMPSGNIRTSAPKQAHCHLPAESVTTDSVAAFCEKQLRSLLPDSVESIRITFDIEEIDGPYYHYSHGLKKHLGNCQRICHGHRSKIEIWKNGHLALDLMQDWASQWQDIYIGSESDLVTATGSEARELSFAYEAQQGLFELTIPKSNCYMIDTDSTVELIASHIANTLKKQLPSDTIRVKAYEGLSKGAIVEL